MSTFGPPQLQIVDASGHTLAIAGDGKLTVDVGTPNVTVSSLPNVTVSSLPNVTVSSMPAVTGTVAVSSALVTGMADRNGHNITVKGEGKLATVDPIRLVGTQFGAAIDTNFWTAATSGAASASTVSNSVATVTSGTANSGYGTMRSARTGRYIPGSPNCLHAYARVPVAAVAGCTRRWGMYTSSAATPTDGAYFEMSPAGVLSVVTCYNSTPSAVSSGNFNGVLGATYVMDANVHGMYFCVGTEEVKFYVDSHLLHTAYATTAPQMRTRDLPINFSAQNAANSTTSGSLEIWSAIIERQGHPVSMPQWRNITAAGTYTLKSGAGTLHSIIVNNKAGTSLAVYDNTGANAPTIATLLLDTMSGIDYNVEYATGLTVVMTGNGNVTIVYE